MNVSQAAAVKCNTQVKKYGYFSNFQIAITYFHHFWLNLQEDSFTKEWYTTNPFETFGWLNDCYNTDIIHYITGMFYCKTGYNLIKISYTEWI